MRKITILEVLDPVKNEFVPIRQAINQGLFNTRTYLFFNPIENKHYSITEAARRGLFKSAIDLRPEALIVERIKVAQTVSLSSARDPRNKKTLLSIDEAVRAGIVDPNLRIYRNTATNQVLDLSDAIDADLIQVKVVRETTEKVTETLTEQKTPENLGLIKKIETSSSNTSFSKELQNEDSLPFADGLKQINGYYLMDRTKSMSINKMMKKYDDDIAAGFITDSNSNKILRPEQTKSLNPVIDFNDAVAKNLVILPDSLCLTQNVQYVLDLNTGNKFDFEAACEIGLIDVKNRKYFDSRANKSISLFEALSKDYIVMKDELGNNYDEQNLDAQEGLRQKISASDLSTMFDPESGEQVSIKKAQELGIYNRNKNVYVDLVNSKIFSLEQAVEKGLAVLRPEKIQNRINEGYQFLHIKAIRNPATKTEMSLSDAINAGFLDYSECEFRDPTSGKTLTLLDAYDKGYLITSEKKVENTFEDFIADNDNETPAIIERKSRRPKEEEEEKVIKQQPEEASIPRKSIDDGYSKLEEVQPANNNKKLLKSRSISPKRTSVMERSSNMRATSSFDIKSMDKLSMSSKKSVIVKLREKMLGKKTRSTRFDEFLIQQSMKIIDTKEKKAYTLEQGIKKGLLFPDDRIRDTLNDTDYSINEAIAKGCIKFFHPINSFEFKYEQSCYIFNNEYLLLVNYVLEPDTGRKIGLKTAFANQIIDKDNCVYFKKRPINLAVAIQKGYLSCEIIEMNQLNSIITSSIFKHYIPPVKQVEDEVPEPELPPPVLVPRSTVEPEVIEEIQTEFYEQDGSISRDLLKKAGINYEENKKYFITEVYDSERDKFVKLKKASFIGLINLDKQEYVDSKTGNSMSLIAAVRKKKILIGEQISEDFLDSTENLDIITSPNYADLDSTIESIKENIKKDLNSRLDESNDFNLAQTGVLTSTLKNSTTYETVTPKTNLTNEAFSYDSFTNSLNSKLNGNFSSKSSNLSEFNLEAGGFNLVKCLLYKKPSNGKYIRFERVIKNKLFDAKNCKVKDSNTNEFLSINEALCRGVLRLNDSNALYDESKIYVIDTVLVNSRKVKLPDAIEKKVVDKVLCTYKFLNTTYSIKEAMKQGYIEGKIITAFEIKWLLEDYANKVESKLNLSIGSKRVENDKQENDENENPEQLTESKEDPLYSPVQPRRPIEFTEFYIFDGLSESYVSMNEAFYNGIVLNEPVRIKDPATNNYILLKDAVIKGLISCERTTDKIDYKNRSTFLTHNRQSYLIDAIYEPRKKRRYSVQDANKTGIFVNGIYKNLYKGESYQIDEAIEKGLILGKRVDLDKIELSFKNSLAGRYQIENPRPPSKPNRGVYLDEDTKSKDVAKTKHVRSRSKSADKRRKFSSDDAILKSQIEPLSAKIVSVQDLVSGKYVKPDEAEKFGLINFLDGTFKNSLTDQVIKINEAMEKGYIIVESNVKNYERKRALSEKSKRTKSFGDDDEEEDILNASRVEIGQQFDILSVLDPIQRKHLELDDAIQSGLFDVDSAMYVDPRTKKKITLVDAIDQGLIKIADKDFHASYKLVVEETNRNFVKNINTLSIRFVVNSFTQQIIPINVAVTKKLVNITNGTYIGEERILSFKEAYDRFYVFTSEDLDNPESRRAKFTVDAVKKSTTGKKMTVKSALAKNWINVDRRIYIDKQTNQEVPFSQAVDMDLLVLKSNLESGNDVLTSSINRSKSRDSYGSQYDYGKRPLSSLKQSNFAKSFDK